jgi:hypothetical protein
MAGHISGVMAAHTIGDNPKLLIVLVKIGVFVYRSYMADVGGCARGPLVGFGR